MGQLAEQEEILVKGLTYPKNKLLPLKDTHADLKPIILRSECPECHSDMVPQGGCMVCYTCGYSKCG